MNWNLFLNLAFGMYILTEVAYILKVFIRKWRLDTAISVLLRLGLSALTISILFRWMDAGRPPFASMYESVVLFAWATTVAFLVMKRRDAPSWLGAPITGITILALGYASLLDDTITPLLPALRSNWLTIHVISYFLAYGVLAVSFVASAILLFGRRPLREPEHTEAASQTDQLDAVGYRGVQVGFPLLTIGLVTGAVWADRTWGSYWSWDPKETWSLICWLVYAAYLHVRIVHGWRGRKAAFVSFLGFLFVLFTYLWLKYLPLALDSLHRYA